MTEPGPAPAVTGFHHFSPTVSDVEASAQWYERVFGMTRVPVPFPHYGDENGGYAVLMVDPRSGVAVGLHHHNANPGRAFDESCTGLDQIVRGRRTCRPRHVGQLARQPRRRELRRDRRHRSDAVLGGRLP